MLYKIGSINNPPYPVENLALKSTNSDKIFKILMPLPDIGFDPSEAAIPWYELS